VSNVQNEANMKKLYQKSEIVFAITWIVAYCLLMSVGDALSAMIGMEKSVTLAIGLALSGALLVFLKRNGLEASYGLCRPTVPARTMLYYLPVLLLLTANLWYGVTLNVGAVETALYILAMFCVGFLEEIIFRGLLYRALRRDNVKVAVIVSSVTFGMGHIINLINGSGAEWIPNLLQVVYATAAGFMFVMMYEKSRSLAGCIAVHGLFNALSVFSDESAVTMPMQMISCLLLTLISGGYGVYLAWTIKKEQSSHDKGEENA
jgi:membrane protease YdiL (CAAX protease family)